MRYSIRERIGMRLEQCRALRPFILQYDGEAPNGRARYVNRISRHVLVLDRPQR